MLARGAAGLRRHDGRTHLRSQSVRPGRRGAVDLRREAESQRRRAAGPDGQQRGQQRSDADALRRHVQVRHENGRGDRARGLGGEPAALPVLHVDHAVGAGVRVYAIRVVAAVLAAPAGATDGGLTQRADVGVQEQRVLGQSHEAVAAGGGAPGDGGAVRAVARAVAGVEDQVRQLRGEDGERRAGVCGAGGSDAV